MSGGGLLCFLPPLPGHRRTALPVPRQDRRRHQLRPAVSVPQENQFEHLSGRPGRRHQRGRRRHLARQLHGLRPWLYRSGEKNLAAPQQPLRAKSVTYVLGTFCYPCLRAGHHLRERSDQPDFCARKIWMPWVQILKESMTSKQSSFMTVPYVCPYGKSAVSKCGSTRQNYGAGTRLTRYVNETKIDSI